MTICCAVRGRNQLAQPKISRLVLESVRYREELGHWYPHLFLLMPDHCHALLSFPQERLIQKTVAAWKRWTSAQCGVEWQSNFFDHRLRGNESFEHKAAYILENPVRAGLVITAEDWPYVLSEAQR